jgi:hypothetical protein
MTKQEALQLVKEMEDFLVQVPGPGKNNDADLFFRERCYDLKIAVPFNVDCGNVVNWAGIYYSAKKWERYGDSKVKTFLEQSVAKVRSRTEDYFNSRAKWCD